MAGPNSEPGSPAPEPAIVRLLITDWRWQVFDESIAGLEGYPWHGWLRIWLEETQERERYEVREWYFGQYHPSNHTVIALRRDDSVTYWPDDDVA